MAVGPDSAASHTRCKGLFAAARQSCLSGADRDLRNGSRGNAVGGQRRFEYWQKSLRYFSASPIFGNETGSIRTLFESDAIGQTGLAAEVTSNPHNQTLSVAIQWGLLGVVLLYAMWLSHLLLFRGGGMASWIGLLVVAQNIISSLNSHLFDFHEGWMYVLGVGVAGGMKLAERRPRAASACDPA